MEALIVQAVATVVGGVSQMVSTANQKDIAYQNWLTASAPQYTNLFSLNRAEEDKTTMMIIWIMAGLIFLLVIAVVVKHYKYEK